MPDAPFITGSDIISNPGNAALGYSSGVAYSGNPADTNPLGQVNTTLNKLQDEEASFQVMKYQKRLQDQKDLSEMLANTGGSIFNVAGPDGKNMSFTPLAEDKVILDQRADALRKAIIENPTGYKYDAGILKQQQELSALKNHASQRAAFSANANLEAAKSNDTEDRQGMLDNLKQEVGSKSLTDFHTPSPYLNKPGWTDETFHPKEVFDKEKMVPLSTGTRLDANGNEIEYNNMGYPIDKLDIRSNITPGNGVVWSQANNILSRFLSSPMSKNPETYIEQNAAIDRFNKERGLVDANGNPISQHAIPHIADVLPNGAIVPNKNLSLPDFVYAMTTASHGALTQQTKLNKNASELATSAQGIKKSNADIKNQEGHLALEWYKAKNEKKKNDQDYEINKSKNEPEEAVSDNAVASTLKFMDDNRKQNDVGVRPLSDAISTLNPTISAAIQNAGINPSDYDVVPLNPADQVLGELTGARAYNPNGTLAKASGLVNEGYYLRSKTNPKNDRVIAAYNETTPQLETDGTMSTDDKGKVLLSSTPRIKLMTPSEMAKNHASVQYNEGGTDKAAVASAKSGNKMNEYFKEEAPKINQDRPTSTSVKFKGDPTKEAPAEVLKVGKPEAAGIRRGVPVWQIKGKLYDENGQPFK